MYHDVFTSPLWRYPCKLDPQVKLQGTFFWGYSDHILQNRRLYNTLTYGILEFFTSGAAWYMNRERDEC